jgi:hypothetical protein
MNCSFHAPGAGNVQGNVLIVRKCADERLGYSGRYLSRRSCQMEKMGVG